MIKINRDEVLNDASKVYNEEVENYGIIQAGTFNAKVINHGKIQGGNFVQFDNYRTIENGNFNLKGTSFTDGHITGGIFKGGTIDTSRTSIDGGVFYSNITNQNVLNIMGGEYHAPITLPYHNKKFFNLMIHDGVFYNTIFLEEGAILHATLKDGAEIVMGAYDAYRNIVKLTIDGNIKLSKKVVNSTSNIEITKNSVLEIDSIKVRNSFINKLQGEGKVKVGDNIWEVKELKARIADSIDLEAMVADKTYPTAVDKAVDKLVNDGILYGVNEQNNEAIELIVPQSDSNIII